MSFLLTFNDPAACDKRLSGGKGASLASLTQAGFQVPDGIILAAEAYNAFAANAEGDPASVLRALQTRGLPPQLVVAITDAVNHLGADTPVAVRSSSTLEDLAEAAFAGQHETFLNCVGLEAVLVAVRACYLSLWQERAVLYRQQQGFAHTDAAMAVVIQKMVQADVAGVGFTIDPISGRLDRMVANASWGLGERVVSGEGEVDQFTFDKQNGTLLGRELGNKTAQIVSTDQGVTEEKLDAVQAGACSMNDTTLDQLSSLMRAVEDHYGFPQDIEWAVQDGNLYLLQARPVTHIPERWTRDESAERFPNPVTPLTWDFVDNAFHRALSHSFGLMGLPPMKGKWFARFGSYIYGNQNAVELYLKPPALPLNNLGALKQALPDLVERYDWLVRLPNQWKQGLDNYLMALGALEAVNLDTLSDAALWSHIKDINALGSDYFRTNIAISIGQASLFGGLQILLKALVGEKDAPILFDGLTAYAETKTATVNEALYELAQAVSAQPELKARLETCSGRTFLAQGGFRNHPQIRAAFDTFLATHGHRETDFDPYHPTWCDAPHIVIDNIKAIVATDQGLSPRERSAQAKAKARKAKVDLLERTPKDLHPFITELLALTRTYTELDDIEHYQTSRLTPVLRKAVGALGSRLKERGLLDDPMDLFFAQQTTIEDTVAGGPEATELLVREIRQNMMSHAEASEQAPCWSLDDEEDTDPISHDTKHLRGTPGSAGIAQGHAYIVRSPEDFADFPEGAILVAATTNPAWTPLFYSASAVVTESGGPLSHGAVTAREVGIPAVMSVRGVMTRLENGQPVSVNGKTGTIHLL